MRGKAYSFWYFTVLVVLVTVVHRAQGQVTIPQLPGYGFTNVPMIGSVSGMYVQIFGVNDSNQFAGNVVNPGYPGGTAQGFFINNDGTTLSIADPGAYSSPNSTGVYGITDTGEVLGSAVYNSAGQGFIYNIASATYTTLPIPSGRPNFVASGISSNGNFIVGRSHYSSGIDVAYEYTGGLYTQLNIPGAYTYAYGVNNGGYVVGDYYPDGGTSGTDSVGYELSPSSQLTPINIAGAEGLTATAINDSGVIVGQFNFNLQQAAGFLLTTAGMFYSVQYPGAVSTTILGINNEGVLTGTYETTNGNWNGFIAMPVPEPASLLVLAMGGLGLVSRRR